MADASRTLLLETEEPVYPRGRTDFTMNDAERMVLKLDAASVITVRFPEPVGEAVIEARSKASGGAVVGGVIGGAACGVLGALVALGTLALPWGPWGTLLVAAGPIVAALSGVGLGATLGGLVGALVGSRVRTVEARPRERQRDEILISVHTDEDAAAQGGARVLVEPPERVPSRARRVTHH